MKRTIASILAGVSIAAAIIACGGSAQRKSAAMPPVTGHADAAVAPGVTHNPDIVKAEAEIDAAMKKLGLEHKPDAVATCPRPPCGGPDAMTAMSVKPTADPKCIRGTSQTCTDNCTLADSICENADKICKIAQELANDAWANGKCAGAETSCTTARGKCCGCT